MIEVIIMSRVTHGSGFARAGAAGFWPGAVVCSGGAQHSRAVMSGVPGAANACVPLALDLTTSQLAGSPPQQPGGGPSNPVPDICLSPASCPFNICNLTSPFKQTAVQTEPSSVTVPDFGPRATFDGAKACHVLCGYAVSSSCQ